MDYKIISFYTGHYQWDAEQLIKSMNRLGIKHYEVDYLEHAGSWVKNTQLKATFILEKLKNNPAVVWTDADSRIRKVPEFFDTIDTDVGLYYLTDPEFKLPEHSILKNPGSYLQSGTMYFKNNEKVIALLERWIELNSLDDMQWDQWTLQYAVDESSISVTKLPSEYVWISGISSDGIKPVIEHLQASRKFKHKLG